LTILETKGLSKWYGNVIAVNDVTMDVGPGITGLLGPNGAGKSTLFRLATGLAKPSAGEIRVLGEDPWDNVRLLRRIGYVPDGDAPLQDESGLRATLLMARLSGLSVADSEQHAEQAMRRVGLWEARDKKVRAYSRGMQQRLKFGFALLTSPELLLLDEPLLGTDPITRRDLIGLIREMAAGGAGVVLSTHVLPDVEALTHRIALVAHGRLLAHGEVAEIRDLLERHPRTIRVGTSQPRRMGELLWTLPSVLSLEATEGAVILRTRSPQAFFEEFQALAIERFPAEEARLVPTAQASVGGPGGRAEAHVTLQASAAAPAGSSRFFTSVTSLDENVEAIFRYLVSE
jgi:ABC-2 type transport system ATP-binding protein